MEQFSVIISTGETLKGCYWPAPEAKANLTIITGMQEYAARYDSFAQFFNSKGINVWCLDAFGQGSNVEKVEDLQKWPEDAFKKNVEAISKMVKLAKANGLPTTHMGHSMGSFMTQSLMEHYPGLPEKTILCGSNGGQKGLMKMAKVLSGILVSKKKWDLPNKTMTNLGLGGYSKAIKDRKTDLDWLSYDEENVQKYIADPYCGAPNTGGFWKEFLKGMATIWEKKNLEKVAKDQKVLIIGGAEDPVGQNGKGLEWLEKTYKGLGVEDVTLIIYPHMRHEIHNEIGKEKVLEDILAFIER